MARFVVRVRRGGPWDLSRDMRQQAIRRRMADDPWATNGMLSPKTIQRWTVVLDGRR